MEGELKDIVLARLERRLKDKDEEIRSLRERIHSLEDSDNTDPDQLKTLDSRVVFLEGELTETQVALSETLKKLASLEALIAGLMERVAEDEESSAGMDDPDLALDGRKEPQGPEMYDMYVGAEANPFVEGKPAAKGGAPENRDALSFFRLARNS